jgi:NAD(P)-dependent dehydrogenase (short-subunit alcohol dehydrogenase family)
MGNRLKDRVIILSGATSGMGKAMALTFAAEGAKLVLNSRSEAKSQSMLEELEPYQERIAWLAGDVSLFETNEALVHLALERFGSVDTIVCNAGTLGIGSVSELSLEAWHYTLNSNVSALFYLSKCALPHMEKNGFGVVLANASIAAFKAFPKHPAYCASKAAQVALVRQIALEYGPGIRANALCPGPVDTPMIWDSAKAFEGGEKAVEDAREATALKRLGQPKDISELALFLISSESSWMTGSAVTIDGGLSIN